MKNIYLTITGQTVVSLIVLLICSPTGLRAQFQGGSGDGHTRADLMQSVTLPLDLLAFTAETIPENVRLRWTTVNEVDVDFFRLERTVDGRTFELVGIVRAGGTTSPGIRQQYDFTDSTPLAGTSLYRLTITDFDGSYEYSDLVEVSRGNTLATDELVMYPNPIGASGTLHIVTKQMSDDAELEVDIYNLTGRRLLARTYRHTAGQVLNLVLGGERLPSGTYTIRITEAGRLLSARLLNVVD